MNGASIMVLALVVLAAVLAVVRRKNSGCVGNCAHCQNNCNKRNDP